MSSIATTISQYVLRNTFVKEIMPLPGKIFGRVILDSLLLAYMLVLNMLFVSSTDFNFPITSFLTIFKLLLSMGNLF